MSDAKYYVGSSTTSYVIRIIVNGKEAKVGGNINNNEYNSDVRKDIENKKYTIKTNSIKVEGYNQWTLE